MCLLPLPNYNITSIAYRKGVTEFDCGACPECLKKRSNVWALRAVYESKLHVNSCMVTLTYDSFKNGKNGVENPVDPNLHVNKRDVQLFFKRLRKRFGNGIKYIACAEYGSRTHRAHYHCILFGVKFDDAAYYKKSKRNHPIYMSKTLTDLWGHGICTIDSVTIKGSIARYCTKYCAKSRSDDTFMLCSHKIGFESLRRDFNGISYWVDGRQYPIPRFIWEDYIVNKYSQYNLNPRYLNKTEQTLFDGSFERNVIQRAVYRAVRDCDDVYRNYLSYWQRLGQQYDAIRPSVEERIRCLDHRKYHNYSVFALQCLENRKRYNVSFPAPGSRCVSAYYRDIELICRKIGICPFPSRPERANDTIKRWSPEKSCNPFDKFDFGTGDFSKFTPLKLVYEQLGLL